MAAVNIAGRRVLVTGASSGVGRAVAKAFVWEGASVAMLARRGDALRELASEQGDRTIPIVADVSDPDSAQAGVREALDALGGLDAVVNAAGVGFPTRLEDIDPATWRNVIDTNLSGSFYVAREAGLRMREDGGGSIVNVASDQAVVGRRLWVHYCASKFGVIGLTKALAAELAPTVKVNVVCPGPIDTPMMDANLDLHPDPARARVEATERVPLKRFAAPGEVVAAIRFLAFEAPFATGTTLELDGGTTIGARPVSDVTSRSSLESRPRP
jgi:NAD(P)-dependent dehydrogenase (short-subunit alcohol dehydrogenase family)